MLDLVLAECDLPTAGGDWETGARSSAISVHAALRRHPWSCALLMAPARIQPARLRYMDSLLGLLRESGLSAETTYHAYHVLDGFIFGFSLWESSHSYSPEEVSSMIAVFTQTVTPDDYPYLHEHGQQHMADGPHREVSAFEFGLDLILDGLKKIHDTA
jgi:hypothetical protein